MTDIIDRDLNTHAIWLETDRLVLREHLPRDLMPLHAMLSDPATTWYIPDMYHADLSETDGERMFGFENNPAARFFGLGLNSACTQTVSWIRWMACSPAATESGCWPS